MKAFVIKNKEGKYFDKESICFCRPDYVCCEHIYYTIEHAKYHIDYYGLKDCEPERITIIEGDFEQQIRKQVCNEIRKFIKDNFIIATKLCSIEEQNQAVGYNECIKDLREFLDQIEKGERNE